MGKLDSRILEEFFYHGIDNVQELLEGIVFFATKQMHNLYKCLDDEYDQPNEIQLDQIRNFAYDYVLQYYRFIKLNEKTSKLIDFRTQDELQFVKQNVDRTIDNLIRRNALKQYGVGYYFPFEEEGKYLEKRIEKNRVRKNWTIEIAEQLKELSTEEKENPVEYYKNWIDIRLECAKDRQVRNEEEINILNYAKEKLEERIARQNLKEEETR